MRTPRDDGWTDRSRSDREPRVDTVLLWGIWRLDEALRLLRMRRRPRRNPLDSPSGFKAI